MRHAAYSKRWPPLGKDITSNDPNVKFHEYSYYIKILEKYDFIKVKWCMGNEFAVSTIDRITIDFMENGGFVTLFNDLKKQKQNQNKFDKIKNNKLINEYRLSSFKLKTFWVFFGISILSIIYNSVNFISNLNRQVDEQQEVKTIKQLELELSKLRTLILDQKSLDSLHRSITLTDSLKK